MFNFFYNLPINMCLSIYLFSEILFNFLEENGEAVYQIQISSVNYISSTNTSIPSFKASNLIPGKTYNVVITVFGEEESSGPSSHLFTTGNIAFIFL